MTQGIQVAGLYVRDHAGKVFGIRHGDNARRHARLVVERFVIGVSAQRRDAGTIRPST